MTNNKDLKPIFSSIHQIGLVVKDLRETIEKYTEYYGITPWNIWEFSSDMVEDMEVRGKRVNYRMMVATCKKFNVDWEIIQPLDDKSIYSEFYDKHGEGLQHINYIVDDYGRATSYLESRGVKTLQYGNLLGKHKYIYFDTESDAKHIMETSAELPGFKRRSPQSIYPPEDCNLTEPIFNRIEGVGIAVKDLDSTVTVLGEKYLLKPWKMIKFDSSEKKDFQVNGQDQRYTAYTAACKVGDVYLMLIEPSGDQGMFSKYLSDHGEGLHHICFSVDNLEKVFIKLKALGKKIIKSGNYKGTRFAFFNTGIDLKFDACFYEKIKT